MKTTYKLTIITLVVAAIAVFGSYAFAMDGSVRNHLSDEENLQLIHEEDKTVKTFSAWDVEQTKRKWDLGKADKCIEQGDMSVRANLTTEEKARLAAEEDKSLPFYEQYAGSEGLKRASKGREYAQCVFPYKGSVRDTLTPEQRMRLEQNERYGK